MKIIGRNLEGGMNFEEARDMQAIWKTGELVRVACELVRAGLARLEAGEDYFGPDDVPKTFTAGGQGLTGSAVQMLRSGHVLEDYFGHHPEAGIVHGRRRSKREAANGRKVCLYRLCGRGMAEAFLTKHGVGIETRQMDLAI